MDEEYRYTLANVRLNRAKELLSDAQYLLNKGAVQQFRNRHAAKKLPKRRYYAS